MEYKITLGDPDEDGHGKSKSYTIQSNLSVDKIREAYLAAVEKTSIHFVEELCAKYADYFITEEMAHKLEEAGINLSFGHIWDTIYWQEEKGRMFVDSDEYVDWLIQFIMLGNPNLHLKIVEDELEDVFSCAYKNQYLGTPGYGLFD